MYNRHLERERERNWFRLVMYRMERTHDSDPTPTIVSPIPTPAKWNHLIRPESETSGVARSRLESSRVARSRPELPGVVRSRQELPGVGVVRSRLESLGVVRSRPESFRVVWSCLESFGVVRSRRSCPESSGVIVRTR